MTKSVEKVKCSDKFRRLPATFPDIGITVISEGLEPSPSDVSVTQDVTTPEPPEVK